jgi:hypothetical protein
MTRRGYTIALVVAVAVLLGSMALTAVAVGMHRLNPGSVRVTDGRPGWGPGMMDPRPDDQAQVAPADAQRIAADWLAANQPGAVLGAGVARPRGYVFPVTRDGVRVGTLLVGDRDGQVYYRPLVVPSPTPTPSATA